MAAFVAASVMNYAFSLILSWILPKSEFGIFGVAQSLVMITALTVACGFPWTAAHVLASSGATSDSRKCFRACAVYNSAFGIVLAAAIWGAYAFGLLRFGEAYKYVVALVAITTVIMAMASVVIGAMRGLYHFGPVAVAMVGEVIVKVGLGLAMVALGAGVPGVMFAFAVGSGAALCYALWVIRPYGLWRGKGVLNLGVLTITAPLFWGILGPSFILNLDILGLKLLEPLSRSDHLAGHYQAAVILARLPVFIAQSIALVLFSYISSLKSATPDATQAVTRRTTRQIAIESFGYAKAAIKIWTRVLFPAALTFILAPHSSLNLFFPAYYLVARTSLRVAAAGGAVLALVTIIACVFQARGNRRRPAFATTVAVAVQILTLIWLVPQYHTIGAALSLLMAALVALASLGSILIHLSRTAMILMGSMTATTKAVRALRHVALLLLPILALALPLVLIPDGGRGMAGFKIGISWVSYLVALIACRLASHELRHRVLATYRKRRSLVECVVDVFIGD